MPRPRPRLVIFLRAPQRGAVKRRLARDLGEASAFAFYRWQSRRLIRSLAAGPWQTILAMTPDSLARRNRFWEGVSPRPRRMAQGRGDLGRRMARILDTLPPGPVVIIGADIPGIGQGDVRAAFAALASHELVFGPAMDGGFWLIGHARRRQRRPGGLFSGGLFSGVRWSGPHALADTRANLPPGREAPPLVLLEDIDDGAAHARWQSRSRKGSDQLRPGPGGVRPLIPSEPC